MVEKADNQVEIVNATSLLRQRKTLGSFCNNTHLLLLEKKNKSCFIFRGSGQNIKESKPQSIILKPSPKMSWYLLFFELNERL